MIQSLKKLHDMTEDEFIEVFQSLSPLTTKLDLSRNKLSNKSKSALINAFSAIPMTVSSLDLASIELGYRASNDIAEILRAIPSNLLVLNLGFNNLGLKKIEAWITIFSALPKNVKSLDLAGNNLGEESKDKLIQILSNLPSNIEFLGLSANHLNQKETNELVEIMGKIPITVTALDLGLNFLGKKTTEELCQIMMAVPSNISSLNLRNNRLAQKSNDELTSIFQAISPGVTSLNLSGNNFSIEQLTHIMGVLSEEPSSIRTVTLDNGVIFSFNQLEIIENFVSSPSPESLSEFLTIYNINLDNLALPTSFALASYIYSSDNFFPDSTSRNSIVLWLLRNHLNDESIQSLVNSCVAKLRGQEIDAWSRYQPNKYMSYHQLIDAAQSILTEYTDELKKSAKNGFEQRYALFQSLTSQQNYNPITAEYLLALPEVRARLKLDVDNPDFIDPVILSSEGFEIAQPKSQQIPQTDPQPINAEAYAQWLDQRYKSEMILHKKSQGEMSSVQELIKEDKEYLIYMLRELLKPEVKSSPSAADAATEGDSKSAQQPLESGSVEKSTASSSLFFKAVSDKEPPPADSKQAPLESRNPLKK